MNGRRGFTLIELLVTMSLASVFLGFAWNIFSDGNRVYLDYRKMDAEYFDLGVRRAKAARMVKDFPGYCSSDSLYRFDGTLADSLEKAFPFPAVNCYKVSDNRLLIYWRGLSASIPHYPVGWTFLK